MQVHSVLESEGRGKDVASLASRVVLEIKKE